MNKKMALHKDLPRLVSSGEFSDFISWPKIFSLLQFRFYDVKAQDSTMSKAPNARAIIFTAGVAATAVTGAWYGAGLKTKKEIKQEVKVRAEATPADKIAYLEQTRSGLVSKKIGLEHKVSQLEARIARKGGLEVDDGAKGRRF